MTSKWHIILPAIITAFGAVTAASIPIYFRGSGETPSVAVAETETAKRADTVPGPLVPPAVTEPLRGEPTTPVAATPVFVRAQATAPVPVRAGPELGARKLFDIPGGRTFRIETDTGASGWLRAEFEGQSGYVRKARDYVLAD